MSSRQTAVRPPARVAALTLVVVAALLVVAGCSSSSSSSAAPAQSGSSDAAGAFPVTIANKFGSTTVTAAPQRVVVAGLVEQDALLALGVVPIATTEWFGEQPGAIFPWAKEALGTGAVPTVLSNSDGYQIEKIASLKPDLIVALYSGLTADDYAKLSKIAPTVAQPKAYADYGIPWQETTTTVGEAVGKSAEAEALVATVEARVAADAAAHPEFQGKTAFSGTPYEGFFVYGPEDPRSRLLAELGFTFPTTLSSQLPAGFGGDISEENATLLDTDTAVWVTDDAYKKYLTDSAAFTRLAITKENRNLILDETTARARRSPS